MRDLSMLYVTLLFVIALNLDDWFRNAGFNTSSAGEETA
jgi:hypothetical protein